MTCRPVRYIKDKEGKFVESKFWNNLYQKFGEQLADKYYNHYIEYYSSNNKSGSKLNGKYRYYTEESARKALENFSKTYDNISSYKVPNQDLWVITIPKPKRLFNSTSQSEDFKRDLEYFNGDTALYEQELKDLTQYKFKTISDKLSLEQFKNIADKLSVKTGIPYQVLPAKEALDLVKTLVTTEESSFLNDITEDNVPAFFTQKEGGLIVIPDNYLEAETAFHEFAHPFIDAITRDNKALFLNLKKQLENSKKGQEIINQVKRDYTHLVTNNELSENGWKEAIVTALGKLADQQLKDSQNKSLVLTLKLLLQRISQYLNSLFNDSNKVISPVEITEDTTMEELASMLHLPNKMDIEVIDENNIQQSKRNLEEDSKEIESQNYQETTTKILDVLRKQLSIYEKRAKGTTLVSDLKDLISKIEKDKDSIESINYFVDDANEWIAKAASRLNTLKDTLKDGSEKLSDEQVNTLIDTLNELNEFSSTYNILDDISFELGDLTSSSVDKMGKMLSSSITLRRQIQREYDNYSTDLIAQWLWRNNPEIKELNTNLKKEGFEEFTIDKLKEELKMASSDIGAATKLLQATISSKDPFSALLARTINKHLETARIEDFNIRKKLTSLYAKKSGTKDNPRSFNKQYIHQIDNYEYVGKDKDGEPIFDYVKRDALITEYNTSAFEKARNEFFKELGDKPTDPKKLRAYNKSIAEWFNENQTIVSDVKDIIETKRKQLTPSQFNIWLEANTEETEIKTYANGLSNKDFSKLKIEGIKIKDGYFLEARGELLRPSDKYKNKKYSELIKDSYYKELLDTYEKANEQLPLSSRLKHGLLPQIEASGTERLLGGTADLSGKAIKDKFTRTFSALEGFDESRYGLTKLSGGDYKQIPVLYTKLIDPKLVSHDLLESILKYSQMSNKFRELYNIESHINTVQNIISNREVAQTTTLGKQKTDSITGKVLTKQEDKKVNEMLNTFINMVYYGEHNDPTNIEVFGKTISVDKTVELITRQTAISSLAFNVASSVTNATWGNYQTFSESGGKLYSKSDWTKGFADFHKFLPDVLADIGIQDKQSFLGQLADYMDCIQGQFEDHYGNNISGTIFKRMINTSSLFFLQHGTEFQIQTTGMLAMMNGQKIKDKQGKEISLLDAYKENFKKNGNFDLSKDYNFTESDRFTFMKKIHAVSKDLHGIYNSFDKPALQRVWYGKLALLFRKHIYRTWMRRYQKGQSDFEALDYKEGYYRTFFSLLRHDLKNMAGYLLLRQNKLSEREKQAINKTIMDVLALTGVILLIAGLVPDEDKNKQGFIAATAELYARRFKQDLIFSSALPTPDTWRVLRTPAVSMSTVEKTVRFLDQALFTWDSDKLYYKRKSGIHEKGDNKTFARASELIPILNSIQNLISPREMNKIFNR